jgi:hypothetical protein
VFDAEPADELLVNESLKVIHGLVAVEPWQDRIDLWFVLVCVGFEIDPGWIDFEQQREKEVVEGAESAADLSATTRVFFLLAHPMCLGRWLTVLEFSGGRSPAAAIPGYPAIIPAAGSEETPTGEDGYRRSIRPEVAADG